MDNRKGKGPKEGSNDHAALKPFVHPMFCNLCGVECTMLKPKCIRALANLLRLENGEPYEILEDDCKIWHLNWLGPVDEEINSKFIKEVTDRVWDNENQHRANVNLIGQIPNKDFSLETIENSAKIYFHMVHKKALGAKDEVKALEWDTTLRCHACRQASARAHCKAVIAYKGQGHPGASALIDTDWCSKILSYSEEELSDNSKLHRTRVGVGITANMVVGYKWRSLDYVAFLHFLSLQSKGLDSVGDPTEGNNQNIVGPSQAPPKKCHRTTKKLAKTTFDITPTEMGNEVPSCKKSVPFRLMVDLTWLKEHAQINILDGVEWLDRFYGRLRDFELLKEDAAYLEELHDLHTL
ncbi:hypothetical protein J3A83DRAFT_4368531 [Scleroderma citrinum]